jgi:hypothetical protein
MTEEVKDFLGSVLRAKFAYYRCLRQAEELEEKCTSLSSPLSSEGHGTADVHKDNLLIALADKTALLPKLYEKWMAVEKEVETFLDGVKDDRYHAILKLRYVDQLRWPKVMEELKKLGPKHYYEERHIYNLHGEALNEARELWSQRKENGHEL